MPTTQSRSATSPVLAKRLDPESRAWLEALRAGRPRREAAIRRLHSLLLCEARHEVRRRTAGLEHPSGRDLEDLAQQAADDALVAILGKLNQFRGDALFTTWARRFAQLEVPGKIRRRLGHTRETPTDSDLWQTCIAAGEEPQASVEASDFARTLRDLIVHQLTRHQREVLVALTIDGIDAKDLAARLDSTPNALYKTLHDARRKLRQQLLVWPGDDGLQSSTARLAGDRVAVLRTSQTTVA
jgi:RNA polymerase sigma-70 factor, ECF subfamily